MTYRLVAIAALLLLTAVISGCVWLREQIAPASYIQNNIDPNFVRKSFFSGSICPGIDPSDEMIQIGSLCVDRFEASTWSSAKGGVLVNSPQAACNINGSDCGTKLFARSVHGVIPSSNISWYQAVAACEASGKRLLTNAEWQAAALGVQDTPSNCNVAGTAVRATGGSMCLSPTGAEDMIGNLAEWVSDWTQSNTKNDGGDVTRPDLGADKIAGIDEAAPESYRLPAAFIRGGSYLDGTGAGVYAMNAQNAPLRVRATIGFRCAR